MKIKENDWKIWLIRSTFGIKDYQTGGSEYFPNRLPQDTCAFLKMFVLSVILLPFSITGHIFNLFILRDTDNHSGYSIFFHLVGSIMFFGFSTQPLPNTVMTHVYDFAQMHSDWNIFLLSYLCGPVMLLCAILIMLIALIILGCMTVGVIHVYEKIVENKNKIIVVNDKKESTHWLVVCMRGLKERYCSKVVYVESGIKEETANIVADYYAIEYKQDQKRSDETDEAYRNRIASYLRNCLNMYTAQDQVLNNNFGYVPKMTLEEFKTRQNKK